MNRLSINQKIWMSISFLVIGSLLSLGLEYLHGQSRQAKYAALDAVALPALQYCSSARAAFWKLSLLSFQSGAEQTADRTALVEAVRDPLTRLQWLGELSDLTTVCPAALLARVDEYVGLLKGATSSTARRGGGGTNRTSPAALKSLATSVDEKLLTMGDELHHAVTREIQSLDSQARRQPFLQAGLMLVALIVTGITLSGTIRRYLLRPLQMLVDQVESGSRPDRRQFAPDEMGALAARFSAFHDAHLTTLEDLWEKTRDRTLREQEYGRERDRLSQEIDAAQDRTVAALADLRRMSHRVAAGELAADILAGFELDLTEIRHLTDSLGETTGDPLVTRLDEVNRLLEADLAQSGRSAFSVDLEERILGHVRQVRDSLKVDWRTRRRFQEQLTTGLAKLSTRLELRRQPLNKDESPSELWIPDLFDEALLVFLDLLTAGEIEVDCRHDPEQEAVVLNRGTLLQIFTQLLSTAGRAVRETEAGEATLHCTTGILTADAAGDEPVPPLLAVDVGFRSGADSSAGRLLAAKNLAAEMGGELEIEDSAETALTWFRFRLPLSLPSWDADEEQTVTRVGSCLD
ncbi:MAG: hypothetical protein ABIF77_10905 [bacterium]